MDNMNKSQNPSENPNNESLNASFVDILNMPIEDLLKKGMNCISNFKKKADEIFKNIQDEEYAKICRPVLTMDECLTWMKVQKENYPQAAYFFIYAEKNPTPRNENDLFSVSIALVDSQKKTIPVKNIKPRNLFASSAPKDQNIVCMVIPTKTLDMKLLEALNGVSSVLIQL